MCHARRLILVLYYRPWGAKLLAGPRWSRGRVVEKFKGIETEKRCHKQEAWKHVCGHVLSGTTGVDPY